MDVTVRVVQPVHVQPRHVWYDLPDHDGARAAFESLRDEIDGRAHRCGVVGESPAGGVLRLLSIYVNLSRTKSFCFGRDKISNYNNSLTCRAARPFSPGPPPPAPGLVRADSARGCPVNSVA